MNGPIVKIAAMVSREQEKLYFIYRKPIKLAWYWLGKVGGFFTRVYLVAMLIVGLMALVEKVAGLSEQNRQSLGLITPVADWIHIRFPWEGFINWLEVIIRYIAASPVILSFLKFSLYLGFWLAGLGLLWLLPAAIANWQVRKQESKQEILREALAPAPSKQDILSRFLTVSLIVWLGLELGERFFRTLGWCLARVNDDCSHDYVLTLTWLTIAVASGLLSVWRMAEVRRKRSVARAVIKSKSQPVSKKIRQAMLIFGYSILTFLILVALLTYFFL